MLTPFEIYQCGPGNEDAWTYEQQLAFGRKVEAKAGAELAQLLQDIDAHMRRMWDERRLPAECWPVSFIQRIEAAITAESPSTTGAGHGQPT